MGVFLYQENLTIKCGPGWAKIQDKRSSTFKMWLLWLFYLVCRTDLWRELHLNHLDPNITKYKWSGKATVSFTFCCTITTRPLSERPQLRASWSNRELATYSHYPTTYFQRWNLNFLEGLSRASKTSFKPSVRSELNSIPALERTAGFQHMLKQHYRPCFDIKLPLGL